MTPPRKDIFILPVLLRQAAAISMSLAENLILLLPSWRSIFFRSAAASAVVEALGRVDALVAFFFAGAFLADAFFLDTFLLVAIC